MVFALQPKKTDRSLSEVFDKTLRSGEEDKFWDSNTNAVILDTSTIVEYLHQWRLWAINAMAELYKVNPYFLILLPAVADELHGLAKRSDRYGNPLITTNLVNDLTPENVRLQLGLPQHLDERVIQMWKDGSRKGRVYKDYEEHPDRYETQPPFISRTDIQVVKHALARGEKRLTSYVVSGDRDVLDTVEAFNVRERLPVYAIKPKPPDDGPVTCLTFLEALVLEDVIGEIRKASAGNYVLIHKNSEVTQNQKKDVAFKVSDKLVEDDQVFSAPIVDDEEAKNPRTFETLKGHRRFFVRRGEEQLPAMYKWVFLLVSRGKLLDTTGMYKEMTIDEYLRNVDGLTPRDKTWRGRYNFIRMSRNHRLGHGVMYATTTDLYLRTQMPALFDHVTHLRTKYS